MVFALHMKIDYFIKRWYGVFSQDEIEQFGRIAKWKAELRYTKSKGSPEAYENQILHNMICKEWRAIKKHHANVSIYDSSGKLFINPTYQKIEEKETVLSINKINLRKTLNKREKLIFDLFMKGYKNIEIASKLRIAKTGVSKILRGIKNKCAELNKIKRWVN